MPALSYIVDDECVVEYLPRHVLIIHPPGAKVRQARKAPQKNRMYRYMYAFVSKVVCRFTRENKNTYTHTHTHTPTQGKL